MDHPDLTLSNFMENSIALKWVNLYSLILPDVFVKQCTDHFVVDKKTLTVP